MKFARILILATAATAVLPAQWINHPNPATPRTPDGKPNLAGRVPRKGGKPDLSGIWRIARPRTIPAAEGSYASLQFWMAPGEQISMQPWAEALFKQRYASFGAGRPSERCLPHGIPDAMIVGNFKIVQDPGLFLILYEEFARFRQIFTDGRTFPPDMSPAWFGYSIGRWDGDVLVVDSRGFNDLTWLDDAGHPHSEAMHTIERFRRRDFGHMEIELTIDDPKAYTKPWTLTMQFQIMPDTELIEDVWRTRRTPGTPSYNEECMDLEGRMSRTERRLDATLKIAQTGMKLLVKMQQETRESKKEMREFKDEMREFKEDTRRGINALIAAQMRSEARQDRLDARVDRLVAALRMRSNGHSN